MKENVATSKCKKYLNRANIEPPAYLRNLTSKATTPAEKLVNSFFVKFQFTYIFNYFHNKSTNQSRM